MAKYRHTAMAELAHQLRLSPARLRLQQIEAAEYLADLLEPAKHYPYEFVCHQITGYRPKVGTIHKPMSGRSVIEDLVLLVEELSAAPAMQVEAQPVRCWSTDELATRLKVSTKTICRWRYRGLIGRKLRFADGTIRMAFSERCIRRFVVKHHDLVRRGAAFSQLTAAQRDQIVQLARSILAERRLKLHELSQEIAAQVGRAVETVRYTLRRHDQAHPRQALFSKNHLPAIDATQQAICDAVAAGKPIDELARQFNRPAAALRAIHREVRIRRLQSLDLACIHNPEFDDPAAAAGILAPLPKADTEPARPLRAPADLPPYLQDLYRLPLLSAEQERHLFRQYNYLKHLALRRRKGLDPLKATEKSIKEVEDLLERAAQLRNAILKANLRLVVSIARRHVGRSAHFFEIVSDGNLALMRAVEKFDYARGFKFSTYASWAIMRNYARTIPEQLYSAAKLVTSADETLAAAPAPESHAARESVLDGLRKLLHKGLHLLTDRERDIVVRHYGLNRGGEAMTLDQIGKQFGVTKERIRQIERKAIRKLQVGLAGLETEFLGS